MKLRIAGAQLIGQKCNLGLGPHTHQSDAYCALSEWLDVVAKIGVLKISECRRIDDTDIFICRYILHRKYILGASAAANAMMTKLFEVFALMSVGRVMPITNMDDFQISIRLLMCPCHHPGDWPLAWIRAQ